MKHYTVPFYHSDDFEPINCPDEIVGGSFFLPKNAIQ
jgi:hypothetical protein